MTDFVNGFFDALDVTITAMNVGSAPLPSPYAIDPGGAFAWPYSSSSPLWIGEKHAEAIVSEEAEGVVVSSGVHATRRVVELGGDVADTIRRDADELDIDIIVGSSTRRCSSRSVSSRLVRPGESGAHTCPRRPLKRPLRVAGAATTAMGVGDAFTLALFAVLWSGSRGLDAVSRAVVLVSNEADRRPWWKGRLRALGLLLATIVVFAIVLSMSVVGPTVGSMNVALGALGGPLIGLVWLYVLALALLLGAEVSQHVGDGRPA